MIGKHLKDYKKAYKRKRWEDRKWCVKKNSDWRKRWMPFIKYDHDFDGFFLLELIIHKLHIMLDYYEHGKYCHQIDESRLEIVDELREACRLGDLLIEDNFDEEAFKVMDAHMKTYTTPCDDGCHELHMDWDTPENHKLYNKLIKEADKARAQTEKDFFDYIRDHYHRWWD